MKDIQEEIDSQAVAWAILTQFVQSNRQVSVGVLSQRWEGRPSDIIVPLRYTTVLNKLCLCLPLTLPFVFVHRYFYFSLKDLALWCTR